MRRYIQQSKKIPKNMIQVASVKVVVLLLKGCVEELAIGVFLITTAALEMLGSSTGIKVVVEGAVPPITGGGTVTIFALVVIAALVGRLALAICATT